MRLHKNYKLLLLLLLPGWIFSQDSPRWEGGVMAGLAGYQGDLSSGWLPQLDETGPLYGLMGRYHLGKQWAVRMDLSYSEVQGRDLRAYAPRNYAFSSTFAAATVGVEWEPLGKRRYPGQWRFNRLVSPYIYVGAGALHYRAEADFSKNGQEQRQAVIARDQAEAFPKQAFLMPVALGVKADLSRRSVLGLEFRTMTAFSDYLDGISHAANPKANDWLPSAALSLTFRLLPKDSDRDGIPDYADACPQQKGVWSALGCPDADGDGVEDLEDLCPNEPGLPKLNGCPDADNDGIADWDDRCPYQFGPASTLGCPDTDGDGIANIDDDCPTLPGPKSRRGCPPLDSNASGRLDDEPLRSLQPAAELLTRIAEEQKAAFELIQLYRPLPAAELGKDEKALKRRPLLESTLFFLF